MKTKIELLPNGKAKLTFSVKKSENGSPHAVTVTVDERTNFHRPTDRRLAQWRDWKVQAATRARKTWPKNLEAHFRGYVYGAPTGGPVDVTEILTPAEIEAAKDVLAKMRRAGAIA